MLRHILVVDISVNEMLSKTSIPLTILIFYLESLRVQEFTITECVCMQVTISRTNLFVISFISKTVSDVINCLIKRVCKGSTVDECEVLCHSSVVLLFYVINIGLL